MLIGLREEDEKTACSELMTPGELCWPVDTFTSVIGGTSNSASGAFSIAPQPPFP
jgi:hypothetical protein